MAINASPQSNEPKPGSLRAWLACIRPKTLGVAAAPVAVGLGIAAAAGHEFHLLLAAATMALSLLMQIITNMENDAGYTKKMRGRLEKDFRALRPTAGSPSARLNGRLNSVLFLLCLTLSISLPTGAGLWP